MTSVSDQRRNIPSVDSILNSSKVKQLLEGGISREKVVRVVRERLATIRKELASATEASVTEFQAILSDISSELTNLENEHQRRSLKKVLNVTGVMLHTNLGRSPLAAAAVEAVSACSGYCDLEYDILTGERGQRDAVVRDLLVELTNAEDALVVNNCAAATWLTLQTIAGGGEVIISRGQLVEIGGSYRLPDIAVSSGVRLREVGTTNKTYLNDYEASLGEETRVILRVHKSNFAQTGFVSEPTIDELCTVGQKAGVPVIDDLGSGCLHDLSKWGLHEPTISESLQAGSDLVLFSGDKLFGGPQCGIILGRSEILQKLRQNPLCRALRVGKLTLAALQATLKLHITEQAFAQIPILKMLSQPVSEIRIRAEKIMEQLSSEISSELLSLRETTSFPGGGALPGQSIPSYSVCLTVENATHFAMRLRNQPTPVIARIENKEIVMDLRSLNSEEDKQLSKIVKQAYKMRQTETEKHAQ